MKPKFLQYGILTIAAAVFTLSGVSCGRSTDPETSRPVIAVTFPQQAALLRPIVGEDFEIVTLLPPGSDPENYEPSMSTMKALTRAQIYFTMDSPGFEQAVLRGIKSNFPDMVVIDSSEGIGRLPHIHGEGNDHHGHHHSHDDNDHDHCASADPHILTSVINARKMASTMEHSLSVYYPEKRDLYSEGFRRLDSVLLAADDSLKRILSGGSRPFVVLHPSLSYFARDYHLKQISLEKEGKEPSPRQYAQTLSRISDSTSAVFIAEKQHSSVRFEETARRMGIPMIEVDLVSENWITPLYKIADSIALKTDQK